MDANAFYDSLQSELGCANDNQLAHRLGLTAPSISMDRQRGISEKVLAKRMKSALLAARSISFSDAIKPVVEFYPINQPARSGRRYPLDKDNALDRQIIDLITGQPGIYSFYNSEAEIIYVGKSTKNLWTEIVQTYNREFKSYKRFVVRHPTDRPRESSIEKARQIQNQTAFIYDTATYFSVYTAELGIVDMLESLLIRVAANDLINTRMEKGTIKGE